MDFRGTFGALEAAVAGVQKEVARAGGAGPLELDALYHEEIAASTALAGAQLSAPEVEMLVHHGLVTGQHRLDQYLLVADYADAARFLREAPLPGWRRPYLRLEEIAGLHARALRRATDSEPGTWRTVNVGPLANGMVPPGPSLVPRQMAALVDRLASGPPAGVSRLLWVADAHERFARIHPFLRGTGRTGRLVTNLLLRRLALPPFVVRGRAVARYRTALERAHGRDPWPLAGVLASSILASLTRLVAATSPGGALRKLASMATGAELGALYKAAQRGRLLAVRRDGALFTTEAWLAAYHASRRKSRKRDTPLARV